MQIPSWLKSLVRTNKYLEIISYLVQNKVLYKCLNSSGEGEFGKSVAGLYQKAAKIAQGYSSSYARYRGSLEGKVVLELGTGFTTATAHLLVRHAGARKVITYDRFNCLHENNDEVLEAFHLINGASKVEYLWGESDILLKKLQRRTIDYVTSNATLEHVRDLDKLLGVLIELVSSDYFMYHKVDLRCHNRFKICGELYFHTFNKRLWKMMGENIGHPSRLLKNDYIELFEKYNLSYEFVQEEYFNHEDLLKACEYLRSMDVEQYKTAIFEVILYPEMGAAT